jgi:hypothetical protein
MYFPLTTATRAEAIVPSDSSPLPGGKPSAGIFIGGAGSLVCDFGGLPVTFTAPVAGTVLNVAPSRVLATGTTATGLIAVYQN